MTAERSAPSGAHGTGDELPTIEAGTFNLYQLFELGDTIDLERAQAELAVPSARRERPPRVRQSDSIQIAQPPLEVELGGVQVELAGMWFVGTLQATIYDLGAVAVAMLLPLRGGISWEGAADLFAAAQELPEAVHASFQMALGELEALIRPAIDKPARSPLEEDYTVLLVERLSTPGAASSLEDNPLVRAALLGERRPLSADAAALVTGMSYYEDDLALLSWNGALVIEPDPLAAETVASLLQFANVELLLLRSYEAELESELLRLNQRIAAARSRLYIPLLGRSNFLLQEAQRLMIDVTEVTERIANAFKVTDDVYWNRLYTAMLATLRVNVWRAGVEHRTSLLRESYGMLQTQVEADRSAALELTIILLIVFEIVLALLTA